MFFKKPVLIALFLLTVITGFAVIQGDDSYLNIDNQMAGTVFYCNSPVAVAPQIKIENLLIDDSADGLKISIANYKMNEDILFYSGPDLQKIKVKWDSNLGNLELTGIATSAEYEAAVRNVFYKNELDYPTGEPRSISISLTDIDYLSATGHFYKYIKDHGVSWKTARDLAAGMYYHGLQGYLATITSHEENEFICRKLDGIGWIGATDEDEEGEWFWVTGPEAGTQFWRGKGNGHAVNGMYSNWNSGEPNNTQKDWGDDEDYAHLNYNPNLVPCTWNDLPNEGDKHQPNGYYFPQGYIVEFGGMPDDPEVRLSDFATIAFSTKPKMYLDDFDPLMCGVNSLKLNLRFDEEVDTEVVAIDANSSVENEKSLNPVLHIDENKFGEYSFEILTTNKHQCVYSDIIQVSYRHRPTALFQIDEAECRGYNLKLNFEGETIDEAFFKWYSNDTLFYSGSEERFVEIPLGFGIMNRSVKLVVIENGCADSIKIPVTVTPDVNFVADPATGCSPVDVKFSYTATEPIEKVLWDFGDGGSSAEDTPLHSYINETTKLMQYNVALEVTSTKGCKNNGIIKNMIKVNPVPSVDFDFEDETCHNETGQANYLGTATGSDTFLWDLSDFAEDEILENPGNSPGPFSFKLSERPSAEIGLQVISEAGCKSEKLSRIIKRKPVFSVSDEVIEGCPTLDVAMELSTADKTDVVDYFWDLGNGTTAEGSAVTGTYVTGGQKKDILIRAVSSLTGCSDILLLKDKVSVFSVPEADFSPDPAEAFITNPVVSFENRTEGAEKYEWDFDDGNFSEHENPEHKYDKMGLYEVSLLAENEHGCRDLAVQTVSVGFDKVFPPTAFSPNAQKEEDREFRIFAEGIVNEGYKMLIFNRWGEVVFESANSEKGWNGSMKNGNMAPAGIYPWVIQYSDFLGKKHKQQGTVTLIF